MQPHITLLKQLEPKAYGDHQGLMKVFVVQFNTFPKQSPRATETLLAEIFV